MSEDQIFINHTKALNKNRLTLALMQTDKADAFSAAYAWRVCQAWHRTSRVKVPTPGNRGA